MRHSEAAFVGIIADGKIEFAYAVLVQRGHGAFDDQPARRAVRPFVAGIADPDHDVARATADTEQRRHHFVTNRERSYQRITAADTVAHQIAVEGSASLVVEDEVQPEALHPRALLDFRGGENPQRFAV